MGKEETLIFAIVDDEEKFVGSVEMHGKTEFFYEADVRNIGSNKLLAKLSDGYEIKALDIDELVTDSGKELKLQGNELKRKGV